MTAITYVDLNEVEAGQENWLAVIARERAEAKREEHKRRLIAEAPARYREYEKKKKRQKFLQLAGLKFEESEHPRDESGRFTSGGGTSGGESFVSPNKDESTLSLDEASQRLHSERQQKLKATFDEIDKLVGADASGAVGAVGAWADGAENSTITIYKGTDYDTIRAAGSMKGLLAEQKAVLTFKYDEAGEHAMLSASFKGSMKEVHDGLSKAGIEFHTLVPKGDSVEVHVFGNTPEVRDAFSNYSEANNGQNQEYRTGHGDFIGSWTSREEGKQEYEAELARYFAKPGMEERHSEWRRVRDNWSQAALKAFEFIQFTKSLETKIARAAVKAAAAAQHTRVEKQAAQAFAAYFQKSVQDIVSRIPKSFKPDPDNAKQQAASLIKRAFKASKQNDLLISSMSQPVVDAFLEGAYAEMRLASAAKRRKKGLKFNENHDESGRFASGGGRSKQQADAIREYTDESNDVNGPLRDGGPESLTGRAKEIYETLQPMAKQPLPAPVTVYRGVQLPSDVEDSLTPGSEHSFPGMSSSSFDLEEAKVFGRRGVMLKITAKTGIVVGEDAATLSSGQKELIQAHGTTYRVIGDVDHSLPGHRRMIELEEIGHSKSLKYNENHDEAGRFASGSGSAIKLDAASKIENPEQFKERMGIPDASDKEALQLAAKLAGATDGSDVSVRPNNNTVFTVEVEHPQYKATRHINTEKKEIANTDFEVFTSAQGKGIGTEIFSRQVHEAAEAGFTKIIAYCAGNANSPYNGYYTWPRLGYDSEVKENGLFDKNVLAYAKDNGLLRVSDFIKSPEHRAWWKENGSAFSGTFDLTEGSQSRKVLEAYVQAKREQQSASGKSTGTDRGGGSTPGSNLGQPGQQQSGVKVTTATQAARRAEHEIDFPTEAPDWLTEAAQDFIIETFQEDYWLRIPETTRDDIELTLYNAIRDGKSIRDIAQEIQDAHGDEYSKYRALNVARTEMTGAMNAGATESISQAFEGTGLTPTKVWLSVLGPTTRDTHAEADGQEVLLDAEFTVGGYAASYPGDARLPPEERCHCQCSLISGEVESQMSDEEEDGKAFDPSQPRDDSGKWTSEGGSSTVGSDHAAESPKEEAKFSESDLASSKLFTHEEESLPTITKQTATTKEELFAQAAVEKKTFDLGLNTGQGVDKAIGADVVRPTTAEEFHKAIESKGATVIIPGLKGEKRAGEKVAGKFGGDWSRLTDVIRATIAVDSKADIPKAVESLRKEMGEHGWKIAEKPDNRIEKPTPGGYRDLSFLVRSENGHVAEIQVNTKAMLAAKEGDGHKLYEQYRTIDESIKSGNREPTAEEKASLTELSTKMKTLYTDAWAK